MNRDSNSAVKLGKIIYQFIFDKYTIINICLKKGLFNK